MSNIFSLKVIKNGQVLLRKQLTGGTRKNLALMSIPAEADVTYVLQSETGGKPLTKIVTKQVGKNLLLTLDAEDSQSPQLLIENYYEFEQSSAIATASRTGVLMAFKPETDTSLFSSGAEATGGMSTWVTPGAESASGLAAVSPLVWAGGALLVAAASHSSGGSGGTDTSATALAKISTYASSSTAAAPLASDYEVSGFSNVTVSNVAAINSAVNRVRADSAPKVQTVITAYLKILAEANGTSDDTTTTDPLITDYQALGIQLPNNPSSAHLSLLNDIVKNRITADVMSVAKLDGLSAIADKILLTAQGNILSTPLTATDFNSIGLSDITASNVGAFLSAIDASADNGSGVSNLTQLKAIDTAYLKILAEANGVKGDTTDLSKLATSNDFKAIGASIGKAGDTADVQQSAALKLLNDVIDGQTSTAVDTVKEITDLAKTIEKVMNISKAANTTDAQAFDLKLAELNALGLTGATADNLAQVTEAIRLTQAADGSSLDALKKLQAAVDLGVVMAYADTPAAGTVPHIAPTLSQYTSLGLPTLDAGGHKAITNSNLSAVNSAVEALGSVDVNTTTKLQTIVDAYSKVLTQANGIKADSLDANKMTLDDFTSLGALNNYDATTGAVGGNTHSKAVTSADAQHTAALKLLNDVIDGRSATQVDTIAEINQLNILVDKVMDVAAGHTPSSPITVNDLNAMGLNSVTSNNLAKILANLQANPSATGEAADTLNELQSFVSLAVVQTYSADPSGASPLPSLQDYKDLGMTDVTAWNSNLQTAVNSVVAASHNPNITFSTVHEIALDYQSILNEATSNIANTNLNPTAAQYEAVLLSTAHVLHGGVAGSTADVHSNALALMNDIVGHKAPASVDSLNELDSLANVVDKVISAASGTTTVSFNDLMSLGLDTHNWNDISYTSKISKINTLIAATDDTGYGVHSFNLLQDIINSSAVLNA